MSSSSPFKFLVSNIVPGAVLFIVPMNKSPSIYKFFVLGVDRGDVKENPRPGHVNWDGPWVRTHVIRQVIRDASRPSVETTIMTLQFYVNDQRLYNAGGWNMFVPTTKDTCIDDQQ